MHGKGVVFVERTNTAARCPPEKPCRRLSRSSYIHRQMWFFSKGA